MRQTLNAAATFGWATAVAIAANLLFGVRWWHPVCSPDGEGAGPYGYAIGLPLPYAQPTGVTSNAYFYMPHIYALDVLLLAGVVCLLVRLAPTPSNFLGGPARRLVAISGAIVPGLAIAAQLLVFSMDWTPVTTIATRPERLWDYRPAFMIDQPRGRRCSH